MKVMLGWGGLTLLYILFFNSSFYHHSCFSEDCTIFLRSVINHRFILFIMFLFILCVTKIILLSTLLLSRASEGGASILDDRASRAHASLPIGCHIGNRHIICIGVNHPAIVREIPHFGLFPAFPHFCENVPHFWLYFEITKIAQNCTNFSCTETFCSKKLCETVNDSDT